MCAPRCHPQAVNPLLTGSPARFILLFSPRWQRFTPHCSPGPPRPLLPRRMRLPSARRRAVPVDFARWTLVAGSALVLLAGCRKTGQGVCPPLIQSIRACVQTAALPITPEHRLPPQRPAPVYLYVDRSGSMNGYLDPDNADSALDVHAGASNLRTTLSRLL